MLRFVIPKEKNTPSDDIASEFMQSKAQQAAKRSRPWLGWTGEKKQRIAQQVKDGQSYRSLLTELGAACPPAATIRGWRLAVSSGDVVIHLECFKIFSFFFHRTAAAQQGPTNIAEARRRKHRI